MDGVVDVSGSWIGVWIDELSFMMKDKNGAKRKIKGRRWFVLISW